MTVTLHLEESQRVRLSAQHIEARPPDRVDIIAEGTITMTAELLGAFEGTTLKPSKVGIAVEGSRAVTIELTGEAALRLKDIDVGMQTPDSSELVPGTDPPSLPTDDGDGPSGVEPGSIAFTVEGAVLSVPEETFEPLSEGSLTLESITFTVDDTLKSDGGSNTDVLFEFTLLGYGIVIHRNGVIEVGARGGVADVGLA